MLLSKRVFPINKSWEFALSLFCSFALCSFTLFTLLKRATGAICSCRSLQKEGVNDSLFTKRGSDLLLSLLQKRERFALFTLNKKRKRLAIVALYKKRQRFALVALTKEGVIRSFHSKQKEGAIRSCCSLQKEEAICSCCSLQKRGNHSVLSLFTKRGSDQLLSRFTKSSSLVRRDRSKLSRSHFSHFQTQERFSLYEKSICSFYEQITHFSCRIIPVGVKKIKLI